MDDFQVYDLTLETYPSTYLLVASLVFLLATVINVVLWNQRHKLNCNEYSECDIEDETKNKLLTPEIE
jgi:hypothetical protein